MQKQDDNIAQIMKEDFEQLSNFSIDLELEAIKSAFSNSKLFKWMRWFLGKWQT